MHVKFVLKPLTETAFVCMHLEIKFLGEISILRIKLVTFSISNLNLLQTFALREKKRNKSYLSYFVTKFLMFNMFPGKLWGIFKCSSSRIHDLAIASHLIYSGKEWELWVIAVGMPLSLIQHLSRWYLLKKPIENFEIIYLIFYLIYCLITYWHDHRENIKWYLQKTFFKMCH